MKQLATSFRKNGFDFKQLLRRGNVALFEKSNPGYNRKHYEVVIIQSHNDYEIAGVKIPAAECMPSSEQWGVYGWSFSTKAKAIEKYHAEVALQQW